MISLDLRPAEFNSQLKDFTCFLPQNTATVQASAAFCDFLLSPLPSFRFAASFYLAADPLTRFADLKISSTSQLIQIGGRGES